MRSAVSDVFSPFSIEIWGCELEKLQDSDMKSFIKGCSSSELTTSILSDSRNQLAFS